MSALVLAKLLAIVCTVAAGFAAGRLRWLGRADNGQDPSRVLGAAAFYIFAPALLFRTTARLDLQALPRTMLLAFFVPTLVVLGLVYLFGRLRQRTPLARPEEAAVPATRAVAVVFGNSVQVGIPTAAALFGEQGLGLHVTLVSLHALVLLSTLTVLAELDLARARAAHDGGASLLRTLRDTVRNTVVHPVVLPVLAGLSWRLLGLPLPLVLDETLKLMGTAVAPLCLVLIGLSLAYTPTALVRAALRPALGLSLAKLLLMPAVVLVAAHAVLGLSGLPLQVAVMMSALPVGSNALLFAQRYRVHEAEASAAIVVSTLAFVLTTPLWLAVMDALALR